MQLRKQLFTNSDCYRAGRTIVPKGVMVHSTGADNPWVSRYVPGDAVTGYNQGGNDWDHPGISKCVHAFVGRFRDGSVGTVQTLPWDRRGWHCASGAKGSGNNTHISFEICEDGLKDAGYFAAVYREAVELTAALCRAFGLDPAADGVVICHQEGYRRGIASNHADVLHWFPKFGKSMDDFRAEVAREMEDTVTQAQFDDMMENWLARRAALPADEWAIPYIRAAVEAGAFADVGGEAGPEIASPKGFPTRQELAVVAAGLLNK